MTNVLILALENEFSEIIYIEFGGRQTIFSTVFGTKFVVLCAIKIGYQIKKICSKLILTRDFALAREIMRDHNLSFLAILLT